MLLITMHCRGCNRYEVVIAWLFKHTMSRAQHIIYRAPRRSDIASGMLASSRGGRDRMAMPRHPEGLEDGAREVAHSTT